VAIQINIDWYLATNPDVAAAVAAGTMTAQEHFDRYGIFEGRSPTPFFDPEQYLAANPDVAAAVQSGSFASAVQHFLAYGATEGRNPSAFFNAEFYLAQNPDVAAAIEAGTLSSAFEHFVTYGTNEARNSTPYFDVEAYLEANPDVAAAVESGTIGAYAHFIHYGFAEGRDLGNGISLNLFSNDPKAIAAVAAGDFQALMARVAEVAPFLPTYELPTGFTIPADQPIPQDFVQVGDNYLVVPDGVNVPPGFEFPPAFGPTNEAPTAVDLINATTSLVENADTAARVKVADISIADDGQGTNTISLTGADADQFEVENGVLYLKAGTTLNYEGKASYAVTVNVVDASVAGSTPVTKDFTLTVTNVDEVAPAFSSGATAAAIENQNLLYTAVATDAVDFTNGTVTYSLKDNGGADDAGLLAINAATGAVTLKTGTLDFEGGKTSYSFTVIAMDATGNPREQTVTVAVSNDPSDDNASVVFAATPDSDLAANTVQENAPEGTLVGVTAAAVDADLDDTITYSLVGDAAGLDEYTLNEFQIDASSGVVSVGSAGLNFEAGATRTIFVQATSSDGTTAVQSYTINVSNVDEVAPTFSSLDTATATENQNVLYTAVAVDTDFNAPATAASVTYSLKGDGSTDDAGLLEINASTGAVTLKSGLLDHEGKTSYTFTVIAMDAAGLPTEQAVTVNVSNVNEAPTAIALSANTIAENIDTSDGVKVGDITITDPDVSGNSNVLSLEGADAASFEIRGTELFYIGTSPNFEAKDTYDVTIKSTDGTLTFTQPVTINVTDVNEAPTAVDLINTTTSLAENLDTTARVKVADLQISDDDLGANTVTLTGDDAASFEVENGVLYLKAGTTLDYEGKASYAVTVNVVDASVAGSAPVTKDFTLTVTDVNEAPTAVNLINFTPLVENTDTTNRVKLGDIEITDDELGSNTVTLTGADAGFFEIIDNALYLKAGTTLDLEGGKTQYDVGLSAADASVSGSAPATMSFIIPVLNVDDTAPTFDSETSVTTAENQALLYTAAATDTDFNEPHTATSVTYSLKADLGDDAELLDINASNGQVTLKSGVLNYEGKNSYTFTVIATDAVGNPREQAVTVGVSNIDEVAPTFSSLTATSVTENQNLLYTAVATDTDFNEPHTATSVTYSLKADLADDTALLNIDSITGAVTLKTGVLDTDASDAKTSYTFTVVATDAAGLPREQAVTVDVLNDVSDDNTPVAFATTPDSDPTVNTVQENAPEGTLVGVTASALDPDSGDTVTYSLVDDFLGTDYLSSEFKIDASTGVVSVGSAGLDFEEGDTRTIFVQATSSDGTTAIQSYNIGVTDVANENPIVFGPDLDPRPNQVEENAVATTQVGLLLNATDADLAWNGGVITYSLVGDASGETPYEAGEFDIVGGDMVVVKGPIDYEAGATRTIFVQATSPDGSKAVQSYTIDVINVGEDGVNDILVGTAAADTLDGKTGDDQITGGAGADHLTGGGGADRFIYATGDASVFAFTGDGQNLPEQGNTFSGMEVITDFGMDSDRMIFSRNLTLNHSAESPEQDQVTYLYGQYDSQSGVFTIGDQAAAPTSGDALILWDGDAASGVQLEAVALVGVNAQMLPQLNPGNELWFTFGP
jgi:hypothetical protein